ncbi:glycosyltransferase family 2 protein [Bdellovibrionota bacterium]
MNQKENEFIKIESKPNPTVSIGFPLFNAEKYLRLSIESLLAQDFKDFELIVSDNCSTDNTFEICKEYAEKDSRIQLHKSDCNRGATFNFNYLFELARAPYFMWAAHDDMWEPSYIRKCLEKLKTHPSAVMCSSEVKFIDDDGDETSCSYNKLDTLGLEVRDRVSRMISQFVWLASYGLFRSDVIRKALPITDKHASDVLFLLKIMLLGEVTIVNEPLFVYRRVTKELEDCIVSMNPKNKVKKLKAPWTGLAKDLLQIIEQSDLDVETKKNIQSDMIQIFCSDPNWWRSILKEGNYAFYKLMKIKNKIPHVLKPLFGVWDSEINNLQNKIVTRAVSLN